MKEWEKLMGCCSCRHCVNETNHWGACSTKWLTTIFQIQKNGENFCIFLFTAGRAHFYIQPEGLWQIMCQGFMMWDVIGPPSWWSKWMCISQWHPHICLAAYASHGVSHSHYFTVQLCTFTDAVLVHHFHPLVFHSDRVTAFPLNTMLIEKWHHATRMCFHDKY